MSTVADIKLATEDLLAREVKTGSPTLTTFSDSSLFRFIGQAYKEINRILKIPTKKVSFQMTSASPDLVLTSVAADIWNGTHGIRELTYLNFPVRREWKDPFINRYGDQWLNPRGMRPATVWMEYDSVNKIRVIPWGITSGATDFDMVYTYVLAVPVATTDAVISDLEAYVNVIPSYCIGRFLQRNRDPRAASFLAEFQGRLADVTRRSKRQGRRNAGEAYTVNLNNYYRNVYGRRSTY